MPVLVIAIHSQLTILEFFPLVKGKSANPAARPPKDLVDKRISPGYNRNRERRRPHGTADHPAEALIMDILLHAQQPLTAQEVHARAVRQLPNLAKSTVYRIWKR